MHRKRVNIHIGPFADKKNGDRRTSVHISIGAFMPGHRFKDKSPRGIMNVIIKSLISFAIVVVLFLIISNLYYESGY